MTTPSASTSASAGFGTPADRAAVQSVLDRLAAAWSSADATAYAALFTDDATYVVFDGTLLNGRTAIEESHRWLFDGPLRGTRLSRSDDDGAEITIRFPRPGVAYVINASAGLRADGDSAVPPGRGSTVSFLLIRDDRTSDWRITAFQNTRQTAQN